MRASVMFRFRDQKGHMVDPRGLLYLPRALLSTCVRATTGYRERIPWISYRAVQYLNRLIQPEWRVLEFGSGMSTGWFGRRCKEMVSIENNPGWFNAVEKMLRTQQLSNVDLRLKEDAAFPVLDDLADGYFDFALVDGINRAACVQTALRKVRRGGYIYLDNSDQYADNPAGDTRIAENVLLAHLKTKPRYFVDFSPGCFFASEGLLAQV